MLSLSKHLNNTRWLFPYALFVLLVCAFLWRPILKGEALLPGDYLAQMSPWNTVIKPSSPPPQWNPLQWDAIAQFYPWRVFYARSMHEGVIPLWNPHQFCGTPFLANGQSAVLYPLNLVFLIFDPITAFTVYAALHLFLAAVFTYLLLRELGCREAGGIVGGVCFAFCAFMVLWLELPTFVGAAVWLPLVLLLIHRAVERRSLFYGMLAGAAQATAFLAGHFQIAFYVALVAGLWWLWKLGEVWRAEGKTYAVLKVVVPFIAFAVIAGLIAAPQVLPTVELAQNSHRVRDITLEGYDRFVSNAVPAYRLVTAFIPGFFGNPSRGDYFLGSAADYMEYGLYIGILPLILALIAVFHLRSIKYSGFFALLALLAILSATGTPINYLFYYLIPGFSALGGPNRILLVYFLGIAALAGFGTTLVADHFTEKVVWRWGRQKPPAGMLAMMAAVFAVLMLAVTALHISLRFVMGLDAASCWPVWGAGMEVWVVLVVASLLLVFARICTSASGGLFSVLAVAVVTADLFAFGVNYNPTCDRSRVYPETELTTKLKHVAGISRIAPINPRWNLYKTPDAILPPNAAMVYGLYDVQGYDSLYTREYKDLCDAAQGEDSSPIENGNMVLLKRFPGESLRTSLHARYVVTREDLSGWIPDKLYPDTLELVGNVGGVTIYDLFTPYFRRHPRPWRWNGPNRESMPGFAPGLLVQSTILYGPGWVAEQAGKMLRIRPFRGLLSAETVSDSRVVFTYQPFSFRLGLFLGCVGVGAIAGAGSYRAVRRRHRRR